MPSARRPLAAHAPTCPEQRFLHNALVASALEASLIVPEPEAATAPFTARMSPARACAGAGAGQVVLILVLLSLAGVWAHS